MNDVIEVVVDHIDRKINQVEEALSLGRAASYAEYKYLCGEIRGLLTAQGIISDLIDQKEKSDD